MAKKDLFDLTGPQRNIWELEQINGAGTAVNHILSVLKLRGNLDENILKKTINKIIESNDSFRLKFIKDGLELHQYVDNYKNINIDVKNSDTNNIDNIVNDYKSVKISLNKLFSFCIVFSPNYTYIVYKTHHIISDAWSATQVAEQIKEIYEKIEKNESLSGYEKPNYIDVIKRNDIYLKSDKYLADEKFWDDYVKDLKITKIFNNNIDKKDAQRFEYLLDDNLYASISSYCKNYGITEYAFFLGIFSLYFYKINNISNVIFGTPFLNRQKRLNELETTGMFVSTLPLHINMNKNNDFVSLCKTITSTNMSLFRHSKFPFHKIQELYYNNTKENNSLYEIGFSYQINKQEISLENNDLGECSWVFSEKQNNPLTIHLTSLNNKKVIFYDYLLSCLSIDEITKMNNIIMTLINEILSEKNIYSEISVLADTDIKSYQSLNSSGTMTHVDQTIISKFNSIVERYPNNIAISFDDTTITYSELNKKINNIAKKLLNLGVTKNTPVVLFFDKSIEMIASMFAILKAGGCYIPILPDENMSRIEYILKDCNPKCILTHKEYESKLPNNIIIINIDNIEINSVCTIDDSKIEPEDIAYIIYTSGSTGNPKGVMVSHKNVCALRESMKKDNIFKARDKDVSLSLLKYSFDASGIDIYSSLLFGGKLVLVKKEDELNPEKVIRIMEKEKVTRSFLIPKWIEHIAIQDKLLNADLSSLRILGTGGEILKPYIIEELLSKYSNLKVLNLYGPTETTMFTTCKQVSVYEIKNNYTSIGRPIAGSRIAIINSSNEFLPIDTPGELIIYEDNKSIRNIASGYLNLPEQTKDKFIQIYHPILRKNVKAYKTGDIAKINKNLEIEFMGRDDDIVKVNGGYLVALNEVEQKIQNLLGNNYKVYPIAIPYNNTKSIILFITRDNKSIPLNSIKNHINSNISFYMRPKKIIELDTFPVNNSGKIDRKKLKEIAIKYIEDSKSKIIKPSTPVEFEIYDFIKELIGINDFSITDDFVDDLGIDSLSLTALYTYLEKYNISIQDIYNNSNIKDLSYFIENNNLFKIEPDIENISNIKVLNNVKKINLETVLLTGVTGFLGIHLLYDLLINDNVKKIYCIIRNKINLNSKQRLKNMVDYYFKSERNIIDLIEQKVIVLNGDIIKDNFGLDKKLYSQIDSEVTTVINSAANVKHFAKIAEMRKDNVYSVNNLIKFCNNSKSLAHISTLSIAGFHGESTTNKVFDENTLYINQEFNNNPYLISKFEAEKNILEATNNGLNAVIFRLGNIMPRFSDGTFQINAEQNVFLSALNTILDTKMVSKDFLGLKLEFSPVDVCSKMIIKLLDLSSSNSIYHIVNNKEISVSELKTLLKFLNYDILDVDLKTFIDEISKYADEYTKEYILSNNINSFSQHATLNKLNTLHISWPSIDFEYMQKVLNIIKKF